jgi:hypothetical protein
MAGAALRRQPLELGLDRLQHPGVEQLAQLFAADELAQEMPVEGEGLRLALGQRRIPLVEVGGDVGEDQRAGERRGGGGLDRHHPDRARGDGAQELAQRRHVEDVEQALAVGLQDDREGRELARHRHQALGAQPLRPQRRARAGAAARQEQRPAGVLAKVAGEQRRARQLRQHRLLHRVGIRDQHRLVRQLVTVGHPHRDAIVAPQRLHREASQPAEPLLQRQRPGGVHPAAERGQDAHPPVAQLVAEALDDHGAIARHHAGGGALLGHVLLQVVRRQRIEPVLLAQPALGARRRLRVELPHEGAQRAPELDRAARPLAAPERHLPRLARRRTDDHPVAGDLLDAPGAGPEQEGLAGAALVHHLLVELADARPVGPEVNPVEAPVRNGAGVGDGDQPGAAPRRQRVAVPVPDDARRQIGELVGGVAPGQHVEHGDQRLPAEVGVAGGAAHQRLERRQLPVLDGAHRHDVLGQHVERIARQAHRLGLAGEHAVRHHRGFEQVAAELGKDAAAADLPDRMAGAPDPLQPARHRPRRLHLDDQIDRPHVDTELERAGGHHRAQHPGLELLLDPLALAARQRAVVGAHQLLAGELVELLRHPLGQAAAVDEEQRGAMRAHELEDARIDRRPQARALLRRARLAAQERATPGWRRTCGAPGPPRPLRLGPGRAGRGRVHVGDRDHDLEIQRRPGAGVDHRHRPVTAEIARRLAQRPQRGRQADPLRLAGGQRTQPLQRQRQVSAALGRHQGVDLVDDDRLDRAQRVARRRAQHQVERLRRGDEDVGRLAQVGAPLRRRCVPGAHRDLRPAHLAPQAAGELLDADQRIAQVAIHVVGQRLERRDVEDPDPALLRRRRAAQAVDAPQECRQRLAAAGRRQHQGMRARGDVLPALRLHRRRPGEASLEPGPGRFTEGGQRFHGPGVLRESPGRPRRRPCGTSPLHRCTAAPLHRPPPVAPGHDYCTHRGAWHSHTPGAGRARP